MVLGELPAGFATQGDTARRLVLVWGLAMKAAGQEQVLSRKRFPDLR